jgi:isopenicillin N synthase-like dioxygenase
MTGFPGAVATVSFTDPDAPRAFAASLHEIGFAVLRDHPIPPGMMEELYAEWRGFFAGEEKHRYRVAPGRQDGFFPAAMSETAKGHSRRDLKEFFHIFPAGQYPAELSDKARRYYALGYEIGGTLLSWLDACMPAPVQDKLPSTLSAMMNGEPESVLRVLHYPPMEGTIEPGAMRAAPHEDINLLTLLPAATDQGLQLLDRTGCWIDVPGDPDSLLVNAGDMLQEVSGGYFRSTTHRVNNPDGEAARRGRISMPMFLQPRAEVVLSARYTAGSYLAERLAELRGSR